MDIDYEELLNVSSKVGYLLLENGAEIYRVEESTQRIIQAYGAQGDVFAIPNCIIASVSTESGKSLTRTKRIYTRGTNFEKVIRLNDLCRRICRDTPDFESIEDELSSINACPVYRPALHVLACSIIALCFTLFFGGTFPDACCAFAAGALAKLAMMKMEALHTNSFFIYIVASGIVAATALVTVHFELGANLDKIIIGTFMNLVPGVVITNAIRDIMAGDLVAGQTKMIEALLIGIAMALGAGIAISITRMAFGGTL